MKKSHGRAAVLSPLPVALLAFNGALSVAQAVAQAQLAPSSVTSIKPSVSTSTATSSTRTNAPPKNYNRALDSQLNQAVLNGNAREVKSLLARNADPNAKSSDSYATPPLCNAASGGNMEIVRALVEAGADLESLNSQGNAPLIFAALNNRTDAISYLLQKGADIEGNKFDGMTALMIAASTGKTEAVRLLLVLGANVNARSKTNGTPLIYGSASTIGGKGNLEIVKMLVDAGADVSVIADNGKRAYDIAGDDKLYDINAYLVGITSRDGALYNVTAKAIREKNAGTATSSTRLAGWQAVKDELAKGANPRYTSIGDGFPTLLNLIIAFSDVIMTLDDNDATMKTIIARSDLDARSRTGGYTALHAAVDNDNAKMVKWLIKAGANLNLSDDKNRTPLDMALENKRQNVIALLQNAGAKTSNASVGNAFFSAMSSTLGATTSSTRSTTTPSATPTPKLVPPNSLPKGPLDKLGFGGKSELMNAAYTGDTAKIAQLLQQGAVIDFPDNEGHTALFFAAYGGEIKAIAALVKAGADINFLDKEGKTPLVSASFAGEVSTIRALVEAGADTKYFGAAISYAKFGENHRVIEYLSALKNAPTATSPTATSSTRTSVATPTTTPNATLPTTQTDKNIALTAALRKICFDKIDGKTATASAWDEVRRLIDTGATARVVDKSGETALTYLAWNLGCDDDLAQKIIARADLNAQNEQGSTALIIAAKRDYIKMVNWLLRAGAKLDVRDLRGSTALDMVSAQPSSDIYIALKKAGAKPSSQLTSQIASSATNSATLSTRSSTATPIATPKSLAGEREKRIAQLSNEEKDADFKMFGALNDLRISQMFKGKMGSAEDAKFSWEIVSQNLDDGASGIYAGVSGTTSLMLVAYDLPGADDETVRNIVALYDLNSTDTFAFGDINAQDTYGATALHIAVENNYSNMVGWLIKAGANLNLLDAKKRTPLDIAVSKKNFAIIQLRDAGAKTAKQLGATSSTQTSAPTPKLTPSATPKPTPKPKPSATPKPAVAKYDGANTTALLKLVQKRPFDVAAADKLIQSGAIISSFDTNGKTPLMLASESGAPEAVEWLLAKKAAVNDVDKNGMTALMYAAARADDEIAWKIAAELCGTDDINLKLKNKAGQTAHDIALDKSNAQTLMTIDIAAEL